MDIKKDSKMATNLINKMKVNFIEREGLHFTDLLYPKKAFFNKTRYIPPTDNELLYFLAGRAHEREILDKLAISKPTTIEWNGIYFEPDFIIDVPYELKTIRKHSESDNPIEDYRHYIEQLKGYCMVLGTNKGYLVLFYLVKKIDDFRTAPDIEIYEVNFSDTELDEFKDYLLHNKELLLEAIKNNSISELPDCYDWMCSSKRSILVQPASCSCGKELKKSQINKHSKECNGTITYPIYKEEIIPLCRYYYLCKEELYGLDSKV